MNYNNNNNNVRDDLVCDNHVPDDDDHPRDDSNDHVRDDHRMTITRTMVPVVVDDNSR